MSLLRAAAIFKKKENPPDDVLQGLVVRGGSEAMVDHLTKIGVDCNEATAVPIFTADTSDGHIKGARWSRLGSLGKGTTFKANSLWKEAGKDIYVNIRVRNMAIFKFPSRQAAG